MSESTQPAGSVRDGPSRGSQGSRAGDPPSFPDPVSSQIVQRACDSTGAILAALRPADLDRPTPCASWTVRDVVNHVLGGAGFFAELAEAGMVADGDEDPDFTAGDFNGTFRSQASRLVAAFNAPGAMDKMMEMPIGELPGSVCVWIAAGDIFTHGCTGQGDRAADGSGARARRGVAGADHAAPARFHARPGRAGSVRAESRGG